MSFTSALPTNLPKFSYVVVAPTTIGVTDSARGSDFTSLKSMTALDVSTGLEASKIKVPVTDLGSGLEFLRLTLRALESALGKELVTLSRKETREIARGSDAISEKVMAIREISRGLDLSVPSVFTAKHPKDALSECLSCLSALYPEIDYDKEIKAIHYNQPVRCILLALSLINYELQRLMRVGVRLEDEVYREVNELWNRVNSWKTLFSGDTVEPEHENEIIDLLVGLEKMYYKLLKYRLLKGKELGSGKELARYKDLTPVADRLVIKPTPIEYYTDKLSPAGGYVLTPPPVAFKEAYATHFTGITMLIYNVSKGTRILWSDVWQGRPSAYVYVYSDCWVVTWFEDLTFYATPDWDWDDVAIGCRIEVLDGKRYVHFVVFEKDHSDTDRCCIIVGGVEYCTGNLGPYQGAVRIAYESWISLD